MKTRLGASVLLAGAVGSAALVAGLTAVVPANAASHRVSATTVQRLATKATFGNVVTTDRGLAFAMWSTGPNTRLEWAVRRPGKSWSTPKVMAS
jgi:hypothetical protein